MSNLKEFNIDGTIYKTEIPESVANRKKWERPNPNHIKSFIPGTIVEIFVKEGQEIKEGECLMILQAMKMKNKILMPFDGKIAKIHVTEGIKVPNRLLMVEIE
ncbi:biotin/lipoyl-binding protein [Labilibaculum sp. DW002]|uniref:Biotin/lipoyl-binding protein n=1 Tax=Paralabilibaculum antarcticum TaxID=2912572 RepID=A0ABT5W126_9BACT|nr:biotin/lipoyl-containing protein [Labilibaculum sp. DW002]MDE5420538.1 biotin/lipoyl-binding protein [Labilibaculum sp. DW002]